MSTEAGLISYAEAAGLMAVSTKTLRNKLSNGALPLQPVRRPNSRPRLVRAEVEALLAEAIAERSVR